MVFSRWDVVGGWEVSTRKKKQQANEKQFPPQRE
jgi:hypothetical protein